MDTRRDVNEDVLEKTIETADLASGGQLNPEQQDAFVVLVKKFSVLLPQVRFVRMDQPKMDIDKLHVGEPVTVAVAENTDPGIFQKAKFNKIELVAKKVQSAWNISTETLQSNIEQDDFETTVMNAMVERIATDLELLAIQGDTTIVGTDPFSQLLVRLNGWGKITDGAHVLDAGGATISKSIFSAAKRRLPKQYKADPALRFMVSDAIATDWMDVTADRATASGDAALQGSGIAPFGIPLVVINLIPDDLAVASAAATPAELKGNRAGPFVFGSLNKVLRVNVNGAGFTVITFTEGTLDAVEVARQINAALVIAGAPATAKDDSEGKIDIRTNSTGAGVSLAIDSVAGGSTANPVIGFPVAGIGPVTGAAAGSGTTLDGSFAWLANPRNFVWGILDGTRLFTEFNKNFDRVETVVYNEVAANVENIDSIVKVTNLRKRPEVV